MEENPHIQELLKVRRLLVEKRRYNAKTVENNIDGWYPSVVKYQEAIEAVDRAIEDEKRLASPVDASVRFV